MGCLAGVARQTPRFSVHLSRTAEVQYLLAWIKLAPVGKY